MQKQGKVSYKNLAKIFKLAYRNLFRNKRRTLFAVVITAAGCASMCVAIGYYVFSVYSLQEMTIRNGFSGSGGSAHLQISDIRVTNIQEQQSLEFGIEEVDNVVEKIKLSPEVDYVMPRIAFGGLISNGERTFPYMGYGVDADNEVKLRGGLSDIDPKLSVGEQLVPLTLDKRGVILGKSLAQSLNAKVGDMLLMYGTTVNGAVNAIDVELLGIMSTGISETDKYYLLTEIEIAQNLINSDKVSNICVMFKDRNNFESKIQSIEKILSENFPNKKLGVLDWTVYGEYYRSIRDLFNIIFAFMGSIILVIVLLSCWNIMNMTTMERIREIGTLRAIGLSIKNINIMFLIEAFLIGVLGTIVGLIIQYLVAFLINKLQITMPPIPGMNQGYTLQVYSFTELQPFIAIGMVFVITLSSLSSLFVIRKYSIVESLEHS